MLFPKAAVGGRKSVSDQCPSWRRVAQPAGARRKCDSRHFHSGSERCLPQIVWQKVTLGMPSRSKKSVRIYSQLYPWAVTKYQMVFFFKVFLFICLLFSLQWIHTTCVHEGAFEQCCNLCSAGLETVVEWTQETRRSEARSFGRNLPFSRIEWMVENLWVCHRCPATCEKGANFLHRKLFIEEEVSTAGSC